MYELMKLVVNMNKCLHSHLLKAGCCHNPVQIWSTALSPSPICWGIHRLPLWSPHPCVQHSQSAIIPTSPPPPRSCSHSWPPPQLMTPLPPIRSLPLLLPFSLCIALPLSLSFFFLPVDRNRSKKKKTRRLLCLVCTWFYKKLWGFVSSHTIRQGCCQSEYLSNRQTTKVIEKKPFCSAKGWILMTLVIPSLSLYGATMTFPFFCFLKKFLNNGLMIWHAGLWTHSCQDEL